MEKRYIEFYNKHIFVGRTILPNNSTEEDRMKCAKSLGIKKFDNFKFVVQDTRYTDTWFTTFDARDLFVGRLNYWINNHVGKQLGKAYRYYNG